MGDDQHRRVDLCVEVDEQLGDVGGADRVEPGVRLVAENDLRVQDEGAGQAVLFAHTAGYLAGQFVLVAEKADDIDPLHDDPADFGFLLAGVLTQGKGDVVEERHRSEERTVLEHETEELPGLHDLPLGAVHHVDAVDEYAPLLGLEQTDEGFQEDGLSGTGRTEHHAHFTGGQSEADILPDVLFAEGFRKAFNDYFDSHRPSLDVSVNEVICQRSGSEKSNGGSSHMHQEAHVMSAETARTSR